MPYDSEIIVIGCGNVLFKDDGFGPVVINILQKNADCNDSCLETCDRGFLGCGTSTLNCNTRPVVLYTAFGNGTPWTMPTTRTTTTPTTTKSSPPSARVNYWSTSASVMTS